MLLIPDLSLQPRRACQVVCVVDCVLLCLFNKSVCIIGPAPPGKQVRKGIMNPKQPIDCSQRESNFEGHLEVVNGLLCIVLGLIYLAKNLATYADPKLFAFV